MYFKSNIHVSWDGITNLSSCEKRNLEKGWKRKSSYTILYMYTSARFKITEQQKLNFFRTSLQLVKK